MVGAIQLLLDAGQAEGMLRPDIGAAEVLGFLWRTDSAHWEQRSGHMLDVVMDGLLGRPEAST